MATFNKQNTHEPFRTFFQAPWQAFVSLGMDTSEKLFNAQLDAQKAYADLGLAQARKLMNVKGPEELRTYMEGQQGVAKAFAERLKGNADEVTSIQRDFFQKSQKLTEENVQQARHAANKLRTTT